MPQTFAIFHLLHMHLPVLKIVYDNGVKNLNVGGLVSGPLIFTPPNFVKFYLLFIFAYSENFLSLA